MFNFSCTITGARRRAWKQVLFATSLVVLAGCPGGGPNLVGVSGVVTLDGKPLEGATILFSPESQPDGMVRPTLARTDSSGRYSIQYSSNLSGTRPGKYKVSIETFRAAAVDNEERVIPRIAEVVPDVYNRKTTLTAVVEEKGGTFDFDLKSNAGPVVQPDGVK